MNLEQTVNDLGSIKVNRREALKMGAVGALALLGLAGYKYATSSRQGNSESLAKIEGYIQEGSSLRTPEDTQALFHTNAGIDLPFSRLDTANNIRVIDDPVRKVMTAIGYLDVENSDNDRYTLEEGACNVYALDLLRLVLGNGVIGSRYNIVDGSPAVRGIQDANWDDDAEHSEFDALNPYLAAFNLDNWMRTYGRNYGWRMADSSSRLKEMLSTGEYIALGVTRNEETMGRVGTGHSFVLTYAPLDFGLTQATNDIRYKVIPGNDAKTIPGDIYNIHTHRLA